MEILIYLGKMMLCSAVLWGYYLLFLKDKTFHHYNRFYLVATLFISALLPLLKVGYFTMATDNRLWLFIQNAQAVQPESTGFHWTLLIVGLLLVVSFMLLTRLLMGIYKIYSLKNRFPMKQWKDINFYETELPAAPFSFFRNLFWKTSLQLESQVGKQILKHEMVHIEQHHSIDKLLAQVFRAVFWFNPVFYFIQKELSLIHEYLADHQAVEKHDVQAFAQMLLTNHFSGEVLPATSPFISSNLKKRLLMLTNSKKPSYSYFRRVMALPLLFCLAFAYLVKAENKKIEKTNEYVVQAVAQLKQQAKPAPTHATKDTIQVADKAVVVGKGKVMYEQNSKGVKTKAKVTFDKDSSIDSGNKIVTADKIYMMKDSPKASPRIIALGGNVRFQAGDAQSKERKSWTVVSDTIIYQTRLNEDKILKKLKSVLKSEGIAEKYSKKIVTIMKDSLSKIDLSKINASEHTPVKYKVEMTYHEGETPDFPKMVIVPHQRLSKEGKKVKLTINGKKATLAEVNQLAPSQIKGIRIFNIKGGKEIDLQLK